MMSSKHTKIGDSVGVVLPKEAWTRLNVGAGDAIFLTESPDGYRVTSYDPELRRQLALARKVMKERRAALGELAK